jgi:mono/diheme cytochrome c family protein
MIRPQQPPHRVASRASRRVGIGCAAVVVLALAGIVAAAVLGWPRVVDLLAGRGAPLPIVIEDHTSPEQVAALRAGADEQLGGYAWVDKEAGIARIPIDRAMAMIAERGLPAGLPPTATPAPAASPEPAETVDLANVTYVEDILPIFEERCSECHSGEDPEEQLELTRYRSALAGSQNGPVIVPGDPENSYLVEQVVSGRMPKDRDPLPEHEIDLIIAWIEQGAPDGEANAPEETGAEQEPAASVDLANVSYQNDVLPIFEAHCSECHSGEEPEEQLELTRYRSAIAGSQNGPVIVPGDPEHSFLVDQIVSGRMPKRGDPLSQQEIDVIIAWIEQGALDN